MIIRIGFGAHYTTIIIRNRQNNIGNDLGPYIIEQVSPACFFADSFGFNSSEAAFHFLGLVWV